MNSQSYIVCSKLFHSDPRHMWSLAHICETVMMSSFTEYATNSTVGITIVVVLHLFVLQLPPHRGEGYFDMVHYTRYQIKKGLGLLHFKDDKSAYFCIIFSCTHLKNLSINYAQSMNSCVALYISELICTLLWWVIWRMHISANRIDIFVG